MSLRRIRMWDWVAAGLGLLLLGLLWQDWYEFPEGGRSGWSAFGALDVLLALAALSALAVPLVVARATAPAWPVAVTTIATAIALLVVPFTLLRLLDQPGRNEDVSVALGGWVGAACLLALVYALYRAMRDQRRPGVPLGPAPLRMPVPPRTDPAHEPPAPTV